MGFWKIVGGAALGVATVVALPVAGPIGAVTAAGAAIAGTAGAVAGGVAESMDDSEDRARSDGYSDGREDALAEQSEKVKMLQGKIELAAQKYKTVKKQEEFITGLLAVGFAISNVDGHIDPEEIEDVNHFVSGISRYEFSDEFTTRLHELQSNPPSFREAMLYVKSYIPKKHWNIIDELLIVAAESDGHICENEKAFMAAWKDFRNNN